MPRESKHNYCPRKRKLIIGQRTRNNNYLHIFRYTRNIWSRNRLTKSLILWWINSSMTLDIPTKTLHKQIDVAITQLNYLFFTPLWSFINRVFLLSIRFWFGEKTQTGKRLSNYFKIVPLQQLSTFVSFFCIKNLVSTIFDHQKAQYL